MYSDKDTPELVLELKCIADEITKNYNREQAGKRTLYDIKDMSEEKLKMADVREGKLIESERATRGRNIVLGIACVIELVVIVLLLAAIFSDSW